MVGLPKNSPGKVAWKLIRVGSTAKKSHGYRYILFVIATAKPERKTTDEYLALATLTFCAENLVR